MNDFTMPLGYLLWWKVGTVDLDYDQLEKALSGTEIPMPARPIPVDVYRRVTGSLKQTYPLAEHELEITTAPVDNPSGKMMARHIVGTVKNNAGVTQLIRRCGDVAFYKPPRGKNSKARMRVTTASPIVEWNDAVEAFAQELREAYEDGVKGVLDSQAIRRLIRGTLSRRGALLIDGGPYFIPSDNMPGVINDLRPVFEALLLDSYVIDVPLYDEDRHRRILDRARKEES